MSEDNVIQLIVSAVDQASAPFKTIESSINALKSTAIGVAAVKVFDLFIENTAEAQASTLRLQQALDRSSESASSSSDNLIKFAQDVAKNSAFSSSSIENAETVLLRFNRLTGPVFDQARQATLDVATALGVDLTTAAESVGRALQSPSQGLRLLTQLQITFTPAQRTMIEALDKGGQAAKAQQIILDAINSKYKDLANTSANTLGGALSKLKNAFNSIFEGSDTQASTLTKVINSVADALNRVNDATKKNGSIGGNISTSLLNSILPGAGTALQIANAFQKPKTPSDFIARGGNNRASDVDGAFITSEQLAQKAADDLAAALASLKEFTPVIDQVGTHFLDLSGAGDKITETNRQLLESVSTVSQKVQDEYDQLTATLIALGVNDQKYATTVNEFIDAHLQLFATTKQISDNLSGAVHDSGETVALSVQRIVEPLTASQEAVHAWIDDFKSSFTSLLESGTVTGRSLLTTFVNVFKNQAIKSAVDDLAAYLARAFSGTSSSNSSGQTVSNGFVTGIFGALFGSAFGRAGGGDFSGPTVVGENGPELATGRGTVYNAQALKSIMGSGGGGVNYTPQTTIIVQGQSGDPRAVAAAIDLKLKENNKDQMKAVVKLFSNNGVKGLR